MREKEAATIHQVLAAADADPVERWRLIGKRIAALREAAEKDDPANG